MMENQRHFRIYRIGVSNEALTEENRRNANKISPIVKGSGFCMQYAGPCCIRENELERRLCGYKQELSELLKGGEAI